MAQKMDAAITNLKENYFRPFENATSYLLMRWFYNGNTKTLEDLDRLVKDVLLKPDFLVANLSLRSRGRWKFRTMKIDEIICKIQCKYVELNTLKWRKIHSVTDEFSHCKC